jgi:hypothetical protein
MVRKQFWFHATEPSLVGGCRTCKNHSSLDLHKIMRKSKAKRVVSQHTFISAMCEEDAKERGGVQ